MDLEKAVLLASKYISESSCGALPYARTISCFLKNPEKSKAFLDFFESHKDIAGKFPNISEEKVKDICEDLAKKGCLLKNRHISSKKKHGANIKDRFFYTFVKNNDGLIEKDVKLTPVRYRKITDATLIFTDIEPGCFLSKIKDKDQIFTIKKLVSKLSNFDKDLLCRDCKHYLGFRFPFDVDENSHNLFWIKTVDEKLALIVRLNDQRYAFDFSLRSFDFIFPILEALVFKKDFGIFNILIDNAEEYILKKREKSPKKSKNKRIGVKKFKRSFTNKSDTSKGKSFNTSHVIFDEEDADDDIIQEIIKDL